MKPDKKLAAEQAVLSYLKATGGVSGGTLRKHVCFQVKAISANSIHALLQGMQAEGLIHHKGNTSGAVWFAGPEPVPAPVKAVATKEQLFAGLDRIYEDALVTSKDPARTGEDYKAIRRFLEGGRDA